MTIIEHAAKEYVKQEVAWDEDVKPFIHGAVFMLLYLINTFKSPKNVGPWSSEDIVNNFKGLLTLEIENEKK